MTLKKKRKKWNTFFQENLQFSHGLLTYISIGVHDSAGYNELVVKRQLCKRLPCRMRCAEGKWIDRKTRTHERHWTTLKQQQHSATTYGPSSSLLVVYECVVCFFDGGYLRYFDYLTEMITWFMGRTLRKWNSTLYPGKWTRLLKSDRIEKGGSDVIRRWAKWV